MNGIQVKNLVKTYITQSTDIILNGAKRPSTTRTVLHGVSVDFPAGKLTAILGRSGCGKSTLLRLIDGTKDAPDSGEIVMPEGWRCALLSPDPYVITWTSVERNVAMAAGAGRTPEERLEMIRSSIADLPNVEAELHCGLLAEYAREKGARILVKGVRGAADFEQEYQMAHINQGIWSELETVLIPASAQYQHVSSTMAREMIRYHQPLEQYLPAPVAEKLKGR